MLIFGLVVALTICSCTKSKEEKAEALIKDKLVASLYHPDTYKPISTRVDSAFFDRENFAKFGSKMSELITLFSKQDDYSKDMESELTTMRIFAPNGYYDSEYGKGEFNDAKEKYNSLKKKLDKVNRKITTIYKELKQIVPNLYTNKITGWIISHQFTSMNGANTVSLKGETIFLCDIEFQQCGDGVEKANFEKILKIIEEFKDSESIDELKDAILETCSNI